ncbi:hypothetical protein XELAEV_18002869mg [Xenopus laevis]|uniref:Secreted protein n=1 Tax=Xenopus laevis TaxID=8355 RepID=A0A974GYJ6_XENLA|nr:hypothetical protein XELAEV_18002869mg [Xenopus laevis]
MGEPKQALILCLAFFSPWTSCFVSPETLHFSCPYNPRRGKSQGTKIHLVLFHIVATCRCHYCYFLS